MIETIWLDVHGVLADFASAYLRLAGRTMPAERPVPYNFGLTPGQFWQPIVERGPMFALQFFSGLTTTDEAYNIFDFACKLCRDVRIVSSPASPIEVRWGEVGGTNDFVWRHFERSVQILCDKSAAARPGHLLIDDSPEQCDRWRARGGLAVLMPRPSNGGPDGNTFELFWKEACGLIEQAKPFAVEVPLPPRTARPNSIGVSHRQRWKERATYKAQCLERVKAALLEARRKAPNWHSATIRGVVRKETARRWDQDNIISSLKAASDAMQKLRVFQNDNRLFWQRFDFESEPNPFKRCVRLIVEPMLLESHEQRKVNNGLRSSRRKANKGT